ERRIKSVSGHESRERMGNGIEDVDQAIAQTWDVVVLSAILHSKSHVKRAANILDVERGVTCRNRGIGKACRRRAGASEFIDRAAIEVGRKEGVLCRRD